MPEPFEPLRETLLRKGVAPIHVRRYLGELSEHYDDLVAEERKAGRRWEEARAAARARLGGDEALAEAMLAQPALRSWTGRAPWATLVVGPFLLLLLSWLAPLLLIILMAAPIHFLNPQTPPPAWLPPVGDGLVNLVRFGGPLAIGCGVALLGARQRSRVIWPVLGCAVISGFGDSLYPVTHWPTAGSRDLGLGVGIRGLDRFDHHYRFSLIDWSHSLPLVAFTLAVAAAVYWMARRQTLAMV